MALAPSCSSRSRHCSMRRKRSASTRSRSRLASSAARIGSASILRISLPMYCFCRYRPPCAVILRASSTASRSASGRGSASSSAVGQLDQRFAQRLQVVAAALALALAGAVVVIRPYASYGCASACLAQATSSSRKSVRVADTIGACRSSRPTSVDQQLSHSQQDLAGPGDARARRGARARRHARPKSASASIPACPSPRGCGEVETLEYQRDRGMGITVYRGKRKGSASTGDLSAQAIRDTVAKAFSIAGFTAEDEVRRVAGSATRSRATFPISICPIPGRSSRMRRAIWRSPAKRRRSTADQAHRQFRRRDAVELIAACACSATRSGFSAASPSSTAQPELRRRRAGRRRDAARLLVQLGARLARPGRRRERSASKPPRAPCVGSMRASCRR